MNAQALPATSAYTRPLLIGLALLALAASVFALYTHYQMILDPLYASAVCDISSSVSCTDVFRSVYGTQFGVPVAAGGVIWSTLVLLLAALGLGSPDRERASAAAGYIFVLAVIGLAAIFYFAYASFFVIGKLCPACATVYVAVIGIFLVASRAQSLSLASLPGRLFKDMRMVFSRPVAATLAIVWLVGSVSLIAFFRDEAPAQAAGTAAPIASPPLDTLDPETIAGLHAWIDRQPRLEEVAPSGTTKVLLVKFNDYQCPSCRATWILYKDVIASFEQKYPGVFTYQSRDYPLEPECGSGGGHMSACEAAVAVRMAKARGQGPRMEAWVFDHQMDMTRDSIKNALRGIANVSSDEFDAQYPKVMAEVREDAQFGEKIGVNSTPTFYLNGIKLGSVRAAALHEAIAYELQKAGVTS
jgi:uncharacterized membrane protein/protein-disulfide isomerase